MKNLSKLVVFPIWVYQYCISPYLPKSCRYYPTCSEYAKEAICVHGPFKGGYLGVARIFKCHPFCKGGIDPVPEKNIIKRLFSL